MKQQLSMSIMNQKKAEDQTGEHKVGPCRLTPA